MNGERPPKGAPGRCTPIVPTAEAVGNLGEYGCRAANMAGAVVAYRAPHRTALEAFAAAEAAGTVLNDAWWGTAVFPVMAIAEPEA